MRHSILLLAILLIAATSCHRSSPAQQSLACADSLMNDRPDSALAILSAIDPTTLTSPKLKARYALLTTKARDKNYFFETDDSLANIAVEYFGDAGPSEDAAWAYFYRSNIYFNRGDMNRAMTDALKGMTYLGDESSDYQKAKFYEHLADINNESINIDSALKYRLLARDHYAKANRKDNEAYTITEIAVLYIRQNMFDEARALLDSIDSREVEKDSLLAGDIEQVYAKSYIYDEKPSEALNHLTKALTLWGNDKWELIHYPTALDIYISNHQFQSADSVLRNLRISNKYPELSDTYHRERARLLFATGAFPQAFAELDSALYIRNEKFKNLMANNVALVERDYYLQEAELDRIKTQQAHRISWMIGICAILCVSIIVIFFIMKLHIRKRDSEIRMAQIETLSREITERNDQLSKLTNYSSSFLSRHWAVIDSLINDYFNSPNISQRRISIEKKLSAEIKSMQSPEALNELIADVDSCHNDLLSRTRKAFPKFTDRDIAFLALLKVGFSARSSSLILDITYGNYFNIRTRLKARIKASDTPVASELLAIFSKSGE